MISRAVLSLALALSVAPAVAADLHVAYRRITLENGLTVILHEDHTVPLVGVDLWFKVGSSHERPGRSGFAHLFEHLMFTGSEHADNGLFDRLLESVGGDNNATTNNDSTDYYEIVPSNALETPLYLDADRLATLGRSITAEKLEAQRGVVKNERRETFENRPYGLTDEIVEANLFPPGHPYHEPIIGSMKDLDAATLDDVRQFFAEFYSPNNAILALAGDFKTVDAEALVRKYFSAIPRGPAPSAVRAAAVALRQEIRLEREDRVELPRLTMAWVTAPLDRPGDAELDAMSEILTGDKTSRLYRRLVYDMQIAQDVHASQASRVFGSVFTISSTARPGHGLAEIEKVIDEELDRLKREPPTAEELAKAKNVFRAGFLRRLERVGGFGGVADQLAAYEAQRGEPDSFQEDLVRYERLTREDLREAVRNSLSRDRRVVLSTIPSGHGELSSRAARPDRSTGASETEPSRVDWTHPPAPGPAPAVRLPDVKRQRLKNGLYVWLIERHELPLVRASLVAHGGSADDPAAIPGLSNLSMALLPRGTTHRSALEVSAATSFLGAVLNSGSTNDSSSVSIDVPAIHANEGLDLLADVVLHPAFSEEELARLKKERSAELEQELAEPASVAARAFALVLYGSGHPYGRPASGTLDSVERLRRSDVESSYSARFAPENSVLIVVGDFESAAAMVRLEQLFGGWSGKAPSSAPPPSAPPARRRVLLIDKPGAAQSEIRIGLPGVARSTPDYFSIETLDALLGGTFTSRLNQNLREVHGYAYGAYTDFSMWRGPGPFTIEAPVQTDSTAASLKEILSELTRITSETPPAEDAARARNFLALSLPQALETSGDLSRRLSTIFTYGLPGDFFDRYVGNVEAVKPEDILRVARQRLAVEKMSFVIVGDLAKIRPEVEKLNLGKVEVVRYDPRKGELVPAR
jgi:zinc protease